MNFLCDNCKQKYHVADEKVRGRAVTRFKCKKCDHVIEVRLAGSTEDATESVADLSAARELPSSVPPPSPAPAPAAAPRPATGPTAAPRPATGLPTAPRQPTGTALPTASRQPTGTALPTATATGAAPRPATAPRQPTGTALPTSAATSAAAKPAPRPATGTGLPVANATTGTRPAAAPSPLRSGLTSRAGEPKKTPSSASMLLNATETGWYAGVRDVPVGPLTRAEVAAKIEAGDITPDSLVWREGLDDWRPLRSVDELSDLLRQAAEKMSGGLLGTMGRKPASAPAPATNVVPIGQARPAEKPGAESLLDDAGEADDEPTRMTSLAELIAKNESSNRATRTGPQAAVPSAAKPAEKPEEQKPAASAAPVAKPASEPEKPAVAPAVAPAEPPAPTAAPVAKISPAALAGPTDPTVSVEPSATPAFTMGAAPAPTATPAPVVAQPQTAKKGGLPLGVWVLILGVGATGVAVGFVMRPAAPPPVAAAVAPAITQVRATPAEPPIGRSVAAEIHLPAEPAQAPAAAPAEPTQPTAPAAPALQAAAAPATRSGSSGTRATNGGSGGSRGGLTAEQLAMMNAQLGGAPAGVGSGSGGPTTSSLRTTQATDSPAGGGLTGAARAGQVLEMLNRSNAVGSCWNAATRRNPAHAREAIRVQVDVTSAGRATAVRVLGASDPELTNCIQTRARGQFYGAGGAITAEASFNLTPGG
jgi:predicted Zn finger-like uncharacterized protein